MSILPSTPDRITRQSSASPIPLLPSTKFVPSPKPKPRPIKLIVKESHFDKIIPFLKSSEAIEPLLGFTQYLIRLSLVLKLRKSKLSPRVMALLSTISILSAIRRLLSTFALLSNYSSKLSKIFQIANWKLSNLRRPPLITLIRSQLDSSSILLDLVYLLGMIKLVPIPDGKLEKIDKLADLACCSSISLGLYQLGCRSQLIWVEARKIRTKMMEMEELSKSPPTSSPIDDVESSMIIKSQYKDKLRTERKKLKLLRKELDSLNFERLRLISDLLFCGTALIGLDKPGGIFDGIRATLGFMVETVGLFQSWHEFVQV